MIKSLNGNVIDTKVTKDGRLYVKVEYNGEPIGRQITEDKKEALISPNEIRSKIIKSNQLAQSSIKASQDYSALLGSPKNRIASTEKYGNFIVGPTTFTSHPEQIRLGGVFRFNGHITSTMPSTIVTPIPVLQFDYPLEDTLKGIAETMKEYEDYLAGVL